MTKILLLSLLITLHPVHVSLLSIEYSAGEKVFNGFLKVYFDDFLLDYKTLTGEDLKPDFVEDIKAAREIAGIYIAGKIRFGAGEKRLNAVIEEISLEDNELRIKMKFGFVSRPKVFVISNSILTDIYKDQSNLLIFKYYNFEEGVKLTPEKTEYVFNTKEGVRN